MKKDKKRKNDNKIKRNIFNVILIILILVFTYSTYKFLEIIYYQNKNIKENKSLIEEVVTKIDLQDEDASDNLKQEEYSIDFEALKKRNKDVVGWIRIPNTNINYPILKGNDNSYYLRRNIDKEYNILGVIFMNYKNDKHFTDSNTTLFGHNTYNNTMFGELKKIYNKELGDEVDIYIYTEKYTYRYRVYSAYYALPTDAAPLYQNTKFFLKTDKEFKYENTNLETLTLSTCHTDRVKRLIIHAMKQEEKNNKIN